MNKQIPGTSRNRSAELFQESRTNGAKSQGQSTQISRISCLASKTEGGSIPPETHRSTGAPWPLWRSVSVDGRIAEACPEDLGPQG